MEQRIFQLSLTTSALFHAVVLAVFYFSNISYSARPFQTVEVIYHTELKVLPQSQPPPQKIQRVRQARIAPRPELLEKKGLSDQMLQTMDKERVKLDLPEKQPARISSADGKRHISVPMVRSEKITSPQYVNYYEQIRSRIRNRAYFYVNDPDFDVGEVYLSFILLSNGDLKQIRINDQRSRASQYLRSVGLRTIQEASPFPPFPSDLKYPELSFNVVIAFEMER